jgi:hypothetical protein
MLDPRSRQMLMGSLRPPDGFRFDCAVGTTFSLDLIALLTAPLAFAMFDWQDDEGNLAADPASPKCDPLALLESLRRCADRVHIFCQAGQIQVPPANQQALTFLEQAVIEVAAPAARAGGTGVFHPKVWVLRFVSTAEPDQVRYRLLCLSRNLTFDRSWDTILVLEGQLQDRQRGIAESRPLAQFIGELPKLAIRPDALSTQTSADTAQIAEELRVVRWEYPEDVSEIRFWPIGLGDKSWPFDGRIDRLLVVSPFLTPGFLDRIAVPGRDQSLVSRPESLREVDPKVLRKRWQCFTLDDGCEAIAGPADEPDSASSRLAGLHAKLYVADAGRNARVWTGSANATTAAFAGNVEFLVELVGKKSRYGVDAALGDADREGNLRTMLAPFAPGENTVLPDPDLKACEAVVDAGRRSIAAMGWSLNVSLDINGAYTSTLFSTHPLPETAHAAIRCRPIMLSQMHARDLRAGALVSESFGPHAIQSISSFVAFEVSAKVGEAEHTETFVLNVPLLNAPTDRKEHILRHLLRDSRTLVRFLLLLLSDDPESLFNELREMSLSTQTTARGNAFEGLPLLEHLLQALHSNPARLDQVQRLIADLRRTPEGREILPPELEAIWEPIHKVHVSITERAKGAAR